MKLLSENCQQSHGDALLKGAAHEPKLFALAEFQGMTVPVSETAKTLRKRFGAWLKAQREEAGLTQLDLAERLDYAYPTTISQIERGLSALPPGELDRWADAIRVPQAKVADKWLYYNEPFIYQAQRGEDVYEVEQVEKPEPTIRRRIQRAVKKEREAV